MLALAAALLVGPATAQVSSGDPLEVPRGLDLRPELSAELPALERIDRGTRQLQDRGVQQLPVLAWSLLQEAESSGDPDLAERAVRMAPDTPAIRFEAARQLGRTGEFASAALALVASFPGIVWLASALGGALGLALLFAGSALALIGFARTVSLHGHALGHLITRSDPPAWPGVLLVLCGLALVPLAGIGPIGLVCVAGSLAALRARRGAAVCLALTVAGLALLLGPGLDAWARFAAVPSAGRDALVVWRVDRAQPLPGDRARLGRAVRREPDDLFLRLGLALIETKAGEVARARELLLAPPDSESATLDSVRANLLGILQLAEGRIQEAIASFEDARQARATAPVLFNLSQAYARGMRLLDRSEPFGAARELDPDLISRYTSYSGTNVHRFLIQQPIPLQDYLARALRPSPGAAALADEVRSTTLGPGAKAFPWWLLAAMGLVAFALRRTTIARCSRCERPLCERCAPSGELRSTCTRCARLFSTGASSDPRVRREQLERDRRRQRALGLGRAAMALALPGSARIVDGRMIAGSLLLILVGTGAALLYVVRSVPVPFEVGGIGRTLPLAAALLCLAPAYLQGLLQSRRQLRRAGGGSG